MMSHPVGQIPLDFVGKELLQIGYLGLELSPPIINFLQGFSATMMILLVDDDKMQIDTTRWQLERAGYEVVTAIDGRQGLR